jgi:hypothetical protein
VETVEAKDFWLREVDLNHRRLGYECDWNWQAIEITGTSGALKHAKEHLGTLIGDIKGVCLTRLKFRVCRSNKVTQNFGELVDPA